MNYFVYILFISVSFSTFSIVAVDIETGQVGSAGASCIPGAIIISDIHPGIGAVHTQSYWHVLNQMYACELMENGYSPSDIIDSLVQNDANNNPTIRQYGIVDMIDNGRSAAYTGENCFDYKGHITGNTYSVQGNILLGEEVLLNMENQFLSTDGPLSDKLMASLQGANIAGADTRCLDDGTSSLSAFIRVANPNDLDMTGDIDLDGDRDISDIVILIDFILAEYFDPNGDMNFDFGLNILDIIILKNIVLDENYTGELYLDLNVNNVDQGIEPIDVLQGLYDEWMDRNHHLDNNSDR